jgi:hypothetical protein
MLFELKIPIVITIYGTLSVVPEIFRNWGKNGTRRIKLY